MGLLYTVLFGFWLCLFLVALGLMLCFTIVGLAPGLTLIALGFKYLTLNGRQFR